MTTRWITPLLGTAAALAVLDVPDAYIVDVRDLVDKRGNDKETIRIKIQQGVEALAHGKRTVVCCDHGVSRSNAIAIGILANFSKVSFETALRQVQEATGETQIKIELLNAVRDALGFSSRPKHSVADHSILLTGAKGFVGNALYRNLSKRLRVVAPTREQLDLVSGSTQLYLLANEENAKCIVHLANPRIYTSNAAMGQTLTMLRNVLEVCIAQNIRMIYLSGWEIYSGYIGSLNVDENTPAFPLGISGETKYLAELLIEHYQRTAGLRCAMLRSSPLYGAGKDKPKFLYNFIDKAQHSQAIVTHRYRNGEPALDLLHINDLISALVAIIESSFEGTLNLGTGVLTSTREIAQIIKMKLGSSSLIKQLPIDADVAAIAMVWRRALFELNWKPTVPLENGLDLLLSEL